MHPTTSCQQRWLIFTIYSRTTGLLNHFFRHYRDTGFTDCVIAVHERCSRDDVRAAARQADGLRVRIVPCYRGAHHAEKDAALVNWLRVQLIPDPGEWAAWADIDEFYEYPMPPAQISRLAPRRTSIIGYYIDQLAADGSLPTVDPVRPLADQFPVPTRLRRSLGCCDRKVMMFRGLKPLRAGHHRVSGGNPHPLTGVVRHYPFSRGVTAAIGQRHRFRQLTGSNPVPSALQRFLHDWEAKGRIDPEAFRPPEDIPTLPSNDSSR